MKKIILTSILYCFCYALQAQTTFLRTYGTIGFSPPWLGASCGRQTNDGGYIFLGTYWDGSANDQIYIIKTNSTGDTIWTKSYGVGNISGFIEQTNDGGYIIGFDGASSTGLLKINGSGNFQWAKTYVGSSERFTVHQTSDGGYIIIATRNNSGMDVLLIKTDASGNPLWHQIFFKSWTGNIDEFGVCGQQTSDGGYIVIGNIMIYATSLPNDFYVIKTNANGDTTWSRQYGGLGNDEVYSGQQTSDGGYILAGATNSYGAGGYDFLLIKINSTGNIQWAKTYGEATTDEYATSIEQTSDGGYIIAGKKGILFSADYTYIIKTDGNGNVLWARKNYFQDPGRPFIEQTMDGGYINTYGSYGIHVLKMDMNGYAGCYDSMQTTPTVLTVTPTVTSGTYPFQWAVFPNVQSMASDTTAISVNVFCLIVGEEESSAHDKGISLFPNPAISELRIENAELRVREIEIYNTLGEKVYSQQQTTNDKQQTVDVSQLLPGVYFVAVTDDKGNKITRKFIKM